MQLGGLRSVAAKVHPTLAPAQASTSMLQPVQHQDHTPKYHTGSRCRSRCWRPPGGCPHHRVLFTSPFSSSMVGGCGLVALQLMMSTQCGSV